MTHVLLIAFDRSCDLRAAARAASEAGFAPCDALSSHPVEGVDAYLAPPPARKPIGWVMFAAGVIGAAVGYAMQWFSAVIDYPIDSGGRPLNSWPAFLLVPYETTILFAGIVGILTWMAMCGLPSLFHALFAAPIVERASQDGYLLIFPFRDDLATWATARFGRDRLSEVRE